MSIDTCVSCGAVIPEGRQVCPGHIKDSGNRRQFESGAVRDIQEGKGRCDLIPLDVVAQLMNSPELLSIYQFTVDGDYQHLLLAIEQNVQDTPFFSLEQAILEVSKHFEEGAKKYGENNWQKGIPTHCYIDSAVRHYLKWCRKDVDEPHDRAFIWNLLCCVWTCKHKPKLNDYESKNKKGETNHKNDWWWTSRPLFFPTSNHYGRWW